MLCHRLSHFWHMREPQSLHTALTCDGSTHQSQPTSSWSWCSTSLELRCGWEPWDSFFRCPKQPSYCHSLSWSCVECVWYYLLVTHISATPSFTWIPRFLINLSVPHLLREGPFLWSRPLQIDLSSKWNEGSCFTKSACSSWQIPAFRTDTLSWCWHPVVVLHWLQFTFWHCS